MFMEANLEFVLYTIFGKLALEVSIVATCKKALLNSSALTISSVKIRSSHFIAGICFTLSFIHELSGNNNYATMIWGW